MNTITIPPEALEAARRAFFDDKGMRGAILAALSAWPGMQSHPGWMTERGWRKARISLPLPQETSNQPGAFDYYPADEEGSWGDE